MLFLLLSAGALWGAWRYFSVSRATLVWSAAGFAAVFVVLQLILPTDHPLQALVAGNWVILGAVALYGVGVYKLRAMAKARALKHSPSPQPQTFKPEELNRYSRHIVLREIGGAGQKALKEARVLVIGAGGVGSPVLEYLAAAGVGVIGVIDDDVVESSNLQRQVIHTDARIGMPKVFSAQTALEAQNPFITIRPYHRRLDGDIAAELFADYDLILDGCDNAQTRYLVNETATRLGKPLISGAISQWEGQISLFDPAQEGPCYACVFPHPVAEGLAPSCAEGGVMAALPGVVGTLMATEAIKYITNAGVSLRGRLLIYDALQADMRMISLSRRAECAVCGARHEVAGRDRTDRG